MLRIRFQGRTDPGRRRTTNEDAFTISDEASFCVLCDGMGGHASGEIASRMAVEHLGERLRAATARPGAADLARAVRDWLRTANDAIYARGTAEPGVSFGRNMGTTLALLWLRGAHAVIAHIGDSRVYRFRDGGLEALTRDHSVTAPLEGEDPKKSGRRRKFVTRALGTRPEVTADVMTLEVRAGDRFLICSDGLTDLVRDREIKEELVERGAALDRVPRALIDLANQRGGRDNITVIVAEVEEAPVAAVVGEDSTVEPPPPLEPPPPWESAERESVL